MAHHKSAKKRIRQNVKRNQRNSALRSALRTALKGFRKTLDEGNAETAQSAYPSIQQLLDKSVTKGILKKQTAARYKSRLAAATQKLKAAA